jgi:hypothetical protein
MLFWSNDRDRSKRRVSRRRLCVFVHGRTRNVLHCLTIGDSIQFLPEYELALCDLLKVPRLSSPPSARDDNEPSAERIHMFFRGRSKDD